MANDGVLLVNFASLQEAGANINRAVTTMRAQLDELERIAKPLVEGWEGKAKEAYAERQRTWDTASQNLANTLHSIMGAVERSADDYLTTEQQATQRFQ